MDGDAMDCESHPIRCCEGNLERHRKHLLRSKRRYEAQHDRLGAINRRNAKRLYGLNPAVYRDKSREASLRLRLAVLRMLGGRCECCGTTEREFLCVDHRRGDGGGYRRKSHHYTYMEVRRAFDSGDSVRISNTIARFRLLCRNCNISAKNAGGVCAHTGRPRPDCLKKESMRMRARLEAVKAGLGGICSCCGESNMEMLTIDHVNGDGRLEPRTSLGTRYHIAYYMRIERELGAGRPLAEIKGRYDLLCANCNISKHYGGGACAHRRAAGLVACG